MKTEEIEEVEIDVSLTARNTYKVPVKQWKKWSTEARKVFNNLHRNMITMQWAFTHPKAKKIPHDQWITIAWNAAWIAASACDDALAKE